MSAASWGLSVSLGGELAEPARIAELAAAAEAGGWDGVFVWDHLWHRDGAPFADPFVTLAAVAVATSRVQLGPLVTPLPRRRPAVVAQQAATLDRLSGGRLVLGVGLGHDHYGEYTDSGEELADGGVDDPAVVRRRAARLDAALEWLLPALTGGPVDAANGRHTTIASHRRPRPPIWVAGSVGRMAGPRRAGRHATDGVAVVGGGEWQPGQVASVRAAVDELCRPGVEVALVGGGFDDPGALAEAGATWLIPELRPGTTLAQATAVAASPPSPG